MINRVGNYEVLHEVVEHNGILYLSGIVADDTTLGMADQTTQALTALARLLEENGSGTDRILQVLIFITDMKLKPEMMPSAMPASVIPTWNFCVTYNAKNGKTRVPPTLSTNDTSTTIQNCLGNSK